MQSANIPAPVQDDGLAELQETIARVRAAQKIYATYSQEKVDEIFKAASLAANRARIPLAKQAVEETGMGVVEDKIIKNHFASEYIYNKYKDTKTCGIVDEDIDASVLLSHICDQGMHCFPACQVEGMEPCISAISLDVINDLLSALHVSACHDHMSCFLSAELCDTDTDSTGGTGYDYYLIF